jgi:hypothetical protein
MPITEACGIVAGAPAHHHIVHQVRSTHGQEDDISIKFLHDMVAVSTGDHCATAYATAMMHYKTFLPFVEQQVRSQCDFDDKGHVKK